MLWRDQRLTAGGLSDTGVALIVVSALSAVVTWPQVLHLSTRLASHHDAWFSLWRLAWVAHALATSPARLFDGNTFHPAPLTLAYSDAMLLEGLLGAPLDWAGVPPVLIYNVLLFAGFIGSGMAVFLLARHLTGSPGPALVAAAIFTMLPYRIEHFGHLELQWAMFIPLTFLTLHRTIETGSLRWGAVAGLCFSLQVYACVYYGVFLAIVLGAVAPILVLSGPPGRRRSAVRGLAAAAVLAAVLVAPYLVVYRAAAEILGVRSPADIGQFSATLSSYLATPDTNRVWGWTAGRWGGAELTLFPGVIPSVLAVLGACARPRRVVLIYVAAAAVAVVLSFGLNGAVYRLLIECVTALRGFRAPARFAIVAACGWAVLAAFGAQLLGRIARTPRTRGALTAALLVLVAFEFSNTPLPLASADPVRPPDVYRALPRAEPGGILEMPVPTPEQLPGWEPYYQAWSRWHWRPLVNGYSGYYPRDYLDTLESLRRLPDGASIERLRQRGVRFVILHRIAFDPDTHADLMQRMILRPEFELVGTFRGVAGKSDAFRLIPN